MLKIFRNILLREHIVMGDCYAANQLPTLEPGVAATDCRARSNIVVLVRRKITIPKWTRNHF